MYTGKWALAPQFTKPYPNQRFASGRTSRNAAPGTCPPEFADATPRPTLTPDPEQKGSEPRIASGVRSSPISPFSAPTVVQRRFELKDQGRRLCDGE